MKKAHPSTDSLFDKSVPPWHHWGPYVSNRSWATVREDYSENGDAWHYFPFAQAHERAYRWGEDAIAGWCDRYQVLVFAPVFWNGKDPILKERLFGLNSDEGNHGEDVKECYYHLDATPTHSYMKYLYKYPQREFPYEELKRVNKERGLLDAEFELVDTDAFRENRYFDVFIEYAKNDPQDLCIKIEVFNRGPEPAPLHLLAQLWFRNQWAWGEVREAEPIIYRGEDNCLVADDAKLRSPVNLSFDYHLGKRYLYGPPGAAFLFTDNETAGPERPFAKDAFGRALIRGESSLNPGETGTKAALHYFFKNIPARGSAVLRLRFAREPLEGPLDEVDEIVSRCRSEADDFYAKIHSESASVEERRVQRQALAGLIWTKQIYLFDVDKWLAGDNAKFPPPKSRYQIRNIHWKHLNTKRVLLMPDKWEYPWFAAWDLAFHCVTCGMVDMEFAKDQLWFLLFEQFQHPNGEIPAYEWEFSDLNPPVQAWAALRLYEMEKKQTGVEDRAFLKKCYLKLILNFVWWVNRVDALGYNIFEGGFLGLDNITLVDRSKEIEWGGTLLQSDGTGWMAMFCLNLMRIALELAKEDRSYEAMATKFFQHFVYIARAIHKRDEQDYSLWNEEDGFFYDVLVFPDGHFDHFRIRSLVGLIPLYAVDIISEAELEQFPEFRENFLWFLENRKELVKDCVIKSREKKEASYLLSLVTERQLGRILKYVGDPKEFRSDFGLRSLSKYHEKHPFSYKDKEIGYEAGVSINRLKGGNSNWRGPVWMPTSYLLIQSLQNFSKFFHKPLKESGIDTSRMAKEMADRLISIFVPNREGVRPFYGKTFPFANDPLFRDHILFYEYFHGDTGEGLGASHQTGWTALVANLIQEFRQ